MNTGEFGAELMKESAELSLENMEAPPRQQIM